MFDEFIKKCFPCGSLLTSISPTMVSKSSWQSSTWWTVMQLCSMHFKATVQAGFEQARVGFKSNKNPKSWHCHGSYRIRHNSLYRFWIATILTKSMQITGFKLERIFSGILFFSSILLQFFNDFFPRVYFLRRLDANFVGSITRNLPREKWDQKAFS